MDPLSVYDLASLYDTLEALVDKSKDRMFGVIMGMHMDAILRVADREGAREALDAELEFHGRQRDRITREDREKMLRSLGMDPKDPDQLINGLAAVYATRLKMEKEGRL